MGFYCTFGSPCGQRKAIVGRPCGAVGTVFEGGFGRGFVLDTIGAGMFAYSDESAAKVVNLVVDSNAIAACAKALAGLALCVCIIIDGEFTIKTMPATTIARCGIAADSRELGVTINVCRTGDS